jgi:hypothetical protein
MSAGSPTKLVRDAGTESYDEPPDEELSQEPEPIITVSGPDSIRWADDAQNEIWDPKRAIDGTKTTVDSMFPGGGPWGATGRRTIWKPSTRRHRGDDGERPPFAQ